MRRPDPVEVIAITVPVLAHAVAVSLFIAACAVLILIASGRLPELPA